MRTKGTCHPIAKCILPWAFGSFLMSSAALRAAIPRMPSDDQMIDCAVVQLKSPMKRVDVEAKVADARKSKALAHIKSRLGGEVHPLLSTEDEADSVKTIYFHIGKRFSEVKKELIALDKMSDEVSTTYIEPRPLLAAAPASGTPEFKGEQYYLGAEGVNVNAAWGRYPPESSVLVRGETVQVADVEFGWLPPKAGASPGHEDLPGPIYAPAGNSTDLDEQEHGTAVVGVLGAIDNGFGVIGIANGATIKFQPVGICLAGAVSAAAKAVGPGGVVLIEVQVPPDQKPPPANCLCNVAQCGSLPAEDWPEVRKVIDDAVRQNVTVVEAAGNGSVPLDSNPFFKPPYDPSAILVAGGRAYGGAPMCWANWGTVIDLEAWGENVATTGTGNRFHPGADISRFYQAHFAGSSSAAAIVAGVVADVQSAAQSICRSKLTPKAVVELLRRTGAAGSTTMKYFGIKPNLDLAVQALQYPCPPDDLVSPAPALVVSPVPAGGLRP